VQAFGELADYLIILCFDFNSKSDLDSLWEKWQHFLSFLFKMLLFNEINSNSSVEKIKLEKKKLH